MKDLIRVVRNTQYPPRKALIELRQVRGPALPSSDMLYLKTNIILHSAMTAMRAAKFRDEMRPKPTVYPCRDVYADSPVLTGKHAYSMRQYRGLMGMIYFLEHQSFKQLEHYISLNSRSKEVT